MSSSHPTNRRVLQVRHLPKTYTQAQATDLMKLQGAHTVTFQRRSVFAFFENELLTRQALHALHQLHLNDSVLLVTFARADYKSLPLLPPVLAQQSLSKDEELIRKLHAVAPHLGLDYILNPMVKYKYPPLNDTILANICEVLRSNQNFYTQVLHLMNKMNLTPPFRRKAVPKRVFEKPSTDASTQVTSESESDLSDTENAGFRKRPRRRKASPPFLETKPTRKPKTDIPLHSLLPETVPMDVTECFEVPRQIQRVEIASIPSIAQHAVDQNVACPGEGFGRIDPPAPPSDEASNPPSRFDFASEGFLNLETLERLPIRDSVDHPAFRNYEEGDCCVRLYIKNLHKSTTEEDLFRVFGQFVPDDEAERAIFDIRLMKSGRMRGQAFVTYGSVPVATKALELTNRLIINAKPMSVQFAKIARVET